MNPLMILQMFFGKEQAEVLWTKWQSMTPEQQQQELSRVNNMSNEEKEKYLKQKGTSLSSLNGMIKKNNDNNNIRKFRY